MAARRNRGDCLMLRHALAEGDSAMKLGKNSYQLWLGAAAFLTPLLLATPRVAAYDPGNGNGNGQDTAPGLLKKIPTPEPATLALLAIGGGAAAVARYRRSRRNK